MPLVTAANIPYNPVPSEKPAETPGADYQRIEGVTPEAFGAGIGRAQAQLGQTFEQSSKSLEEIAIERQRLTNQVAANDSTNFVMDETTKLLHGDPSKPGDVGYYGLKGVAAINARQSTVENLDKQIAAARSRLSNPRQLLMFDNETRRMRNYWMGEIGRHYDQQLTQSAIGTAQAQGKLAENMTAQTAANLDMNGFSLGVENQMKAAIDEGRARGWTQPQIDEKFALIRAGAVSTWVQSMVEKNPTQARDFLEANKDALVTGEYHRLQGLVRAKADKATVDQAVFSAPKTAGSMIRGGAIQGRITEIATQVIYDPKEASTVASLESSMGQNLGQRGNIFQLGDSEWASVGGGQKGDPDTDIRNGIMFLKRTKEQLTAALGREPIPAEVYLAHQQGVNGATKLLNNPNVPAGQLVPPENIRQNGGDPNAPASNFIGKWTNKYNSTAARLSGSESSTVAIGDSIAAHLIRKAGVGGVEHNTIQRADSSAVSGFGPTDVLGLISSMPEENIKGRDVILSTGVSNNPDQIDQVGSQIQTLKARGAKSITVLGVGTASKLAGANAKLEGIAAENGAAFAGALPEIGADQIHSTKPKTVLTAAQAAMSQGTATVTPAINPPPDVVINNRPLPQREPAELPDTQISGAMFPGGMTLTQKLQQLARDMPNNDEHDRELFVSAVKAARSYANGEYAAQQHIHRQQQEVDKASDQSLLTEYNKRMSGQGVYPTVQEVLADKRWKDPKAAQSLVGFIEREARQDPAAAQSKINTNNLYTRMNLPEGTQGRLSTESEINEAYTRGDIIRQDHDWLIKQYRDSRSAGGETLTKLRAEFIRNVAEPQIKGPESQFDNLWGERLWQYQAKLDADIKRYVDEGKNRFDLFDPDKPDYVGRDNFLGYYRSKMFSSLRDAPDAALPTQPLDLSTRDKVKEAYGAHKLTWDQAAEALQKLGHPMRSEPAAGPQVPVR